MSMNGEKHESSETPKGDGQFTARCKHLNPGGQQQLDDGSWKVATCKIIAGDGSPVYCEGSPDMTCYTKPEKQQRSGDPPLITHCPECGFQLNLRLGHDGLQLFYYCPRCHPQPSEPSHEPPCQKNHGTKGDQET